MTRLSILFPVMLPQHGRVVNLMGATHGRLIKRITQNMIRQIEPSLTNDMPPPRTELPVVLDSRELDRELFAKL